jgi:hypothetical protein
LYDLKGHPVAPAEARTPHTDFNLFPYQRHMANDGQS